jgi:hypothetical protein
MLEPLPIQVEPRADESGVGFCLRSVQLNRLNLHWLRRSAGIAYGAQLDAKHAITIGHVTGCSERWLGNALPRKQVLRKETSWDVRGHRFFSLNHLRRLKPQICPHCVHREGYCRAVWDFSAATMCVRHGCYLEDACAHCRRLLAWDRPAIDTCNCGRLFKRTPRDEKAGTDGPMQVSMISELLLNGEPIGSCLAGCGLPSYLAGISLDGFLNLVQAFGTRTRAHERDAPSIMSRHHRSSTWFEVSMRSIERLKQLAASGDYRLFEPFVSRCVIERMVAKPASETDRQIGMHVFASIYGDAPAGRMSGKRPELSQANLFE